MEYAYFSSESSPEPGQFRFDEMPYQRGIMEAVTDPDTHTIVLMMASQTGKTTIMNSILGYYVHQDPAPIMMVQPTKEMGQAWSKDRLVPMIRDTPVLAERIRIDSRRDGENEILHKKFPGGHLTITGANSPAGLASRPIRILLMDEVDRFPLSAKKEGNPVKLAIKRTTAFTWNKKIILCSSPTIAGESRIEQEYEASDKRRCWVPCPQCGAMQPLMFQQLKWPEKEPEKAHYVCMEGCIITEADKYFMLQNHQWRPEAEFKGVAGFHISSLYSPKVTFAEFAKGWVDAKTPEDRKVFINTEMAETYDDNMDGEGIEKDTLENRVEDYTDAPAGVLLITAAVDTQDDRLEVEIVGWGMDNESWSLQYQVIYGDPGLKEIWQELDDLLEATIRHVSGREMKIACICVDAGGHHAEEVYFYCRSKQKKGRRIYAVRGSSTPWRPIITKLSSKNSHKCKMFFIGTDTAKDSIFSWLKVETPGTEGYCHFPAHYPDHYFEGLTSEKKIRVHKKGVPIKKYELKKKGMRNEPLDLRVYNLAALKILKPNYAALALRMEKLAGQLAAQKNAPPAAAQTPDNESKPEQAPASPRPAKRPNKGGGFVNRWKR